MSKLGSNSADGCIFPGAKIARDRDGETLGFTSGSLRFTSCPDGALDFSVCHHLSAAVWTGASQSSIIASSSVVIVSEQPAISSDVT